MLTLKVPQQVGPTKAPTQTKFGPLSPRPKVKDGKLIAGKVILVLRSMDRFGGHTPELENKFFTNGLHQKCMEVRYGTEFATYRLYDEPVVYSDGPPHPDHLQLAVRFHHSPGIAESEDT